MTMTTAQRREFTRLVGELATTLQMASDSLAKLQSTYNARKGMKAFGLDKAGVKRGNLRYQPMGAMRREAEREEYRGFDITGIESKLLKAAVKGALDIMASKGALGLAQGVAFSEVKAKGYIASCSPSGEIKLNEPEMKALEPHEMLQTILHELAHFALSHHSQHYTSADEQRLEAEADVLSYGWLS